jgi:hypothetical protein
MNATCVTVLVILMTMCIGPGCGRSQKPPKPPVPPRDGEIVYETTKGRGLLAKYTLAPVERDAMMDILVSSPTEAAMDIPATLSLPWGMLYVAGRYYAVDGGMQPGQEGQILMLFREGNKETVYVWRSDRITTLAKHLFQATTNRDIQDAFAAFAVQQGPATEAGGGSGPK